MPLQKARRESLTNDPGYIAAKSNVDRAIQTVRKHLGMDVAFVSEFVGDSRIFRHVASIGSVAAPIAVGDVLLLAEGYCKKIVDGELPQFIANTALVPAAMAIPDTHSTPIGSHLSVPLILSDGHLYGTFCCFSYRPHPDLTERDFGMMKAFADMIAYQIDTEVAGIRERVQIFDRVQAALISKQPSMVFQPCFSLDNGELFGAEALARFEMEPKLTPDVWFADAGEVNLQVQLELQAIRNAIRDFAPAWESGPYELGLNCSPDTIIDPRLAETISDIPPERIVLEITEHEHVADYAKLIRALRPLRDRGVKIAVDDAGSGYASMRHVLNILPDIIKLDVSLTNGIETDLTRLALARALCEFGQQIGSSLIAEGIENQQQFDTLRNIGVHSGQGYFLGRPMPFSAFEKLLPRPAVAV